MAPGQSHRQVTSSFLLLGQSALRAPVWLCQEARVRGPRAGHLSLRPPDSTECLNGPLGGAGGWTAWGHLFVAEVAIQLMEENGKGGPLGCGAARCVAWCAFGL